MKTAEDTQVLVENDAQDTLLSEKSILLNCAYSIFPFVYKSVCVCMYVYIYLYVNSLGLKKYRRTLIVVAIGHRSTGMGSRMGTRSLYYILFELFKSSICLSQLKSF